MSLIVKALIGGVLATMSMDIGAVIGHKLGFLKGVHPELLAKWFGWIFRGKLIHQSIETAPAVAFPFPALILMHYMIGTTLAVTYVLILHRTGWRGNVVSATAFGIGTNVLPWLLMFPAMGFGFFGLHGPEGTMLFRTSFVNHLFFGIGLGVAMHLILRLR
jgi:hypothetical protein